MKVKSSIYLRRVVTSITSEIRISSIIKPSRSVVGIGGGVGVSAGVFVGVAEGPVVGVAVGLGV